MNLRKSLPILFLSFLLFVSSIFAWLELYNPNSIDLSTSDFVVEIHVYLNDVLLTNDSPFYDDDNHLISLNASDSSVVNFIENLKVTVSITAKNAARVRFLVQDEWQMIRHYYESGEITENVIPYNTLVEGVPNYPFTLGTGIFLTQTDPFLYYEGLLGKAETLEVTLIDGGIGYLPRNTEFYEEEVLIRFQLYVDVVQANRIVELWKLEPDFFD